MVGLMNQERLLRLFGELDTSPQWKYVDLDDDQGAWVVTVVHVPTALEITITVRPVQPCYDDDAKCATAWVDEAKRAVAWVEAYIKSERKRKNI